MKVFRYKDWLTVIFACIYLGESIPARATSLSDMMQVEGFKGMVIAVANLNRAMQEAAKNPMNDYARQNVSHAIGLMPLAIQGLAKEFKDHKLKSYDFPVVKQVLGSYVTPVAADQIKSFVANPSASNIPSVGKNFPANVPGQANAQNLVMLNSAKPVPSESQSSGNGLSDKMNRELASITTEAKIPEKKDNASLSFDDNAKKGDSEVIATSAATKESTSSRIPQSELSSILNSTQPAAGAEAQSQAQLGNQNGGIVVKKAIKSESKSLDKDFFNTKDKREAPKAKKRTSFINFLINNFGIPSAYAEDDQQEQKKGEQIGEILFGLAAIMAAVSPMVAASIQANADKDIAHTKADAQKYMADKSAQVSEDLAAKQYQISKSQTDATKEISAENQQAATERVSIQVSALEKSQEQAAQLEREKRAYQAQLDTARLDMAKEQYQQTINQTNQQFRAQLMAAGLSQGVGGVQNSASGLSVTRGNTLASAQQAASNSNPLANTLSSGKGSLGGNAFLDNAVASNAVARGSAGGTAIGGNKAEASLSSAKLVSAALDSADVSSQSCKVVKKGKKLQRVCVARKKTINTPAQRQVAAVNTVLGGNRVASGTTNASSDLGSLINGVDVQANNRFSNYVNSSASRTVASIDAPVAAAPVADAGAHKIQAYNAVEVSPTSGYGYVRKGPVE